MAMASLRSRGLMVVAVACSLAAGYLGYRAVALPRVDEALLGASAKQVKVDEATYMNAAVLVDQVQRRKVASQAELAELKRLLTNAHPQLRKMGIKGVEFALGGGRAEEGKALIAPLLRDREDAVRSAALISLYGLTPEDWPKWRASVANDGSPSVLHVVKYYDDAYTRIIKP